MGGCVEQATGPPSPPEDAPKCERRQQPGGQRRGPRGVLRYVEKTSSAPVSPHADEGDNDPVSSVNMGVIGDSDRRPHCRLGALRPGELHEDRVRSQVGGGTELLCRTEQE